MKIRIGPDTGPHVDLDVSSEPVTLRDVFCGIGIETDRGRFGIAMRDDGIEVLLNGKLVWPSSKDSSYEGRSMVTFCVHCGRIYVFSGDCGCEECSCGAELYPVFKQLTPCQELLVASGWRVRASLDPDLLPPRPSEMSVEGDAWTPRIKAITDPIEMLEAILTLMQQAEHVVKMHRTVK